MKRSATCYLFAARGSICSVLVLQQACMYCSCTLHACMDYVTIGISYCDSISQYSHEFWTLIVQNNVCTCMYV